MINGGLGSTTYGIFNIIEAVRLKMKPNFTLSFGSAKPTQDNKKVKYNLTKRDQKEYDIKYQKGVIMQPILANYTASITELKKSPTQLLQQAGDEAIAILNHNVTSAYLVPSHIYEQMIEIIDDYELKEQIKERLDDAQEPIKVNLDEL